MALLYFKVGPSFWIDHPWNDDERLSALYILTSPHRTSEGLFRMPLEYARTDLGWKSGRFEKAFDQLVADHFIEYDHQASVCLIVNAMKWQKPGNPNQRVSALKAVAALPYTPLLERFHALAVELCPPLADDLAEAFPEGFAKGFRKPIGHPPTPAPTPVFNALRVMGGGASARVAESVPGPRFDGDVLPGGGGA